MADRETWSQFVQRVTNGKSQAEIASAAKMDASGVSRWFKESNKPRAESVVNFARGLGVPPVEALMAAGYLEPDEVVGSFEVMPSLVAFDDASLIAELAARLAQRTNNTSGITGTGLPTAQN